MTFHIGTPHTRGAGYMINGVNLTRPYEADVQVCAHCQAVVLMQEWVKKGAWCQKEMKPLCLACGKRALTFGCEPFLKQLEAFTRAQIKHAQFLETVAAMPPLFTK